MKLEPGETSIEEDGFPDEDLLLTVCAGIVIIDKESNIIRLVHHTTQEYFERVRFKRFPTAQAIIAKACLTYISLDATRNGPCFEDKAMTSRLQNNPLLHYAAQNWGVHAQGPREKMMLTDIVNFLKISTATECAIQVSTTTELYRHNGWSQEYPSSVPEIAYAASFGLLETVNVLLDGKCCINASGSNRKTALCLAASGGHEAVIELLLERGAEIDSKNGNGRTALSGAASCGHEAVVELLLERGAEIHRQMAVNTSQSIQLHHQPPHQPP
ncbi:MAG: hypothetical protein M1827_007539 [Pycnora praestabilis]|nr:MAG: hypothetical protein M1827_007539 [Pycnora praestabilis]